LVCCKPVLPIRDNFAEVKGGVFLWCDSRLWMHFWRDFRFWMWSWCEFPSIFLVGISQLLYLWCGYVGLILQLFRSCLLGGDLFGFDIWFVGVTILVSASWQLLLLFFFLGYLLLPLVTFYFNIRSCCLLNVIATTRRNSTDISLILILFVTIYSKVV